MTPAGRPSLASRASFGRSRPFQKVFTEVVRRTPEISLFV